MPRITTAESENEWTCYKREFEQWAVRWQAYCEEADAKRNERSALRALPIRSGMAGASASLAVASQGAAEDAT